MVIVFLMLILIFSLGQMSMFILFSEALTNTSIYDLFLLGYDYVPNFYEKE